MGADIKDIPAWADAPFREARFNDVDVAVRQEDDGTVYIEQLTKIPPYPERITELFLQSLSKNPSATCLAARRTDGDWQKMTYAEVFAAMQSLGQFLLDHGVSEQAPLVILSGNSIDHALLGLAALHVGVPYAPLSPAYSLIAKDFNKLKDTLGRIKPGMVYADDAERFGEAMKAISEPETPLIASHSDSEAVIDINEALATQPTKDVDEAHEAINGDTIAKFLFTSGSTGNPKAVINTHRMICSSGVGARQAYSFVTDTPPIILDWAPWHHTAGGNADFFLAMFNGGSFYIDDGKPTPGDIHKTVRNIKSVSPTWYFNVPKGYEALVQEMEQDLELRQAFFKNVDLLWYAGANLAQHTWDSLEKLAVETTGKRVLIGTGLGATETAPAALYCTWPQVSSGNVGLPAVGVTLKLVPFEGRYDARVKGPNVTPGYYNEPKLTADAFDEEGFYKFGDALRPADADDFSKGFFFDGRTAENFKLDSGTWVNTGALRISFIDHFGSAVKDVVITGADRPYLGAMIFPDILELQAIAKDDSLSLDALLAHAAVRAFFEEKLKSFAGLSTGSSTKVRRALLMEEPPSLEKGEATDKGSINQRTTLRQRAPLVAEIYDGSARILEI